MAEGYKGKAKTKEGKVINLFGRTEEDALAHAKAAGLTVVKEAPKKTKKGGK